ncbi:MAG: peptide-methionine (R)-S-oxide reductase MsrB [Leptospirillia bacterium]
MSDSMETTDAEWRDRLTPEQYAVCREKGTEAPFSGQYWDCTDDGVYHCICCGNPLFEAATKFDAGCGWPSYYQPIADDAVRYEQDDSHGMHRVEVICGGCDSHLGHVFPDGPEPTGQRYCINSVCLNLKPQEEGAS